MLVLTRRRGESIRIGDDIVVTVMRTGKTIRIGIDAPQSLRITRGELTTLDGMEAGTNGETTPETAERSATTAV